MFIYLLNNNQLTLKKMKNLYEIFVGQTQVRRYTSQIKAIEDFNWAIRTIEGWSESDQKGMKIELYKNGFRIRYRNF